MGESSFCLDSLCSPTFMHLVSLITSASFIMSFIPFLLSRYSPCNPILVMFYLGFPYLSFNHPIHKTDRAPRSQRPARNPGVQPLRRQSGMLITPILHAHCSGKDIDSHSSTFSRPVISVHVTSGSSRSPVFYAVPV